MSLLQDIFSSKLILVKTPGNKLKLIDLIRQQQIGARSSNFSALRKTMYSSSSAYNRFTPGIEAIELNRQNLYSEYEAMDSDAIISSALDIYADECTVKNANGDLLAIETDNTNLKRILTNLFYDVLDVEFNLWHWIRGLVKNGDAFLLLNIMEDAGVVSAIPVHPSMIRRIEEEDSFYFKMTDVGYHNINKNRFEPYEIAHFRLLSDTTFLPYGKCLSGDTHIDTEFGSKYLKDIELGDNIYSFNIDLKRFELTKVLNKVKSGIKPILKICSQHNFIKASSEHPILIFDTSSKTFKYKSAENIEIGDLIVIKKNNNKKSKIYNLDKNLAGFNKNGWKNQLKNIPDIADEEFSELLGFLIGDGWGSKTSVHFAMGMNTELNERYIKSIQKYSGKSGQIYLSKNGISGQFNMNSKMFAQVMLNNGLQGKAKTKRIPNWIFESESNIQMAFIRGLTNADGWSSTDKYAKRYSIELCNKDLIYDFKRLIQFNDIKTSIPVENSVEKDVVICGIPCRSHGSYRFNYYLDGNKKQQFKRYKFNDSDEIIIEPVRKIIKCEAEETYDIQVESINSNFIANGIIVHNSMIEGAKREYKKLTLMEDAMLIHRIMRAPARRVFKIDIGNIEPNEVETYLEDIMNKNTRVPVIDADGSYNMDYNLMSTHEDYYLPVRGDKSGTNIETLDGLSSEGSIEDIEYVRKKMMMHLKIPKAYLGDEETTEGKCVSPDTLIPLISGEVKTVGELITDYENGIKNYVYSIDTEINEIRPGEIEWAGYTRMNAKVVRIILDNDKYIDCTPDHKFLLRNGEWLEAQYLKSDDSLMPLYLGLGGYKNHYTTVYHPGTGKYELVHKIVAAEYNIKEKSENVIHHIDFNSKNNNPENLDGSMNYWEHRKYHQDNLTEMKRVHPKMIEYYANTELRKQHCSAAGKIGGLKSGPKLADWVRKHGPANKKPDLFIDCVICGAKTKIHHCDSGRKYCGKLCADEAKRGVTDIKYNSKYNTIDFNLVKSLAAGCKNFSELYDKIQLDGSTFRKMLKYYNIPAINFIFENMPLAISNRQFMNNYRSEEAEYKNHKVKDVIFLDEHVDTCDLTIKKYHNFGTEAGVIIHNSLLAAEDVRFARTIERIQQVIINELYNIAYIHLISQGFSKADLLEFSLSLNNSSLIFERQKIELLKEKIDLAVINKENNLFSRRYMYENLFNMSDTEWKAMESEIVTDLKQKFREKQIEEEGNDPKITGKSFGTAHDLASMYANLDKKSESVESTIKDMNSEDMRSSNPGRPTEPNKFGTVKDKGEGGLGRDPFGAKSNQSLESFINFKNNSLQKTLISEEIKQEEYIEMLDTSLLKEEID